MKSIFNIFLTGRDSFWPGRKWMDQSAGTIFCSYCKAAYQPAVQVDAVVETIDRDTDLDAIGFTCGGTHILSNRLVSIVGSPLLNETGKVGRLFDKSGVESETHVTVNAKRRDIIIRGSPDSLPGLCKECGRILYSPVGDRYVLNHHIPEDPFFLCGIYAFCTREFLDEKIIPAKLNRIDVTEMPIVNEPRDGLPSSPEELSNALRLAGKFK